MEIKTHGSTYRETECDVCKCVFSYTLTDTAVLYSYSELGSSNALDRRVRCPECGNCIKVKEEGDVEE